MAAPRLIDVFAVEDDRIQLTWSSLPAPEVTIEVGDQSFDVVANAPATLRRRGRAPRPMARSGEGVGGPGALNVAGLAPGHGYDVCLSAPGLPRAKVADVTTLRPPPGRLLFRLATVNDIHIGEGHFGAAGTISDVTPLPADWDPYPQRCARAAIAEADEWGAQLLIVKGDLTKDSEPVEFHEVGRLLATAPMPVLANLGNHDVRHGVAGIDLLASHGVVTCAEPTAHDVPGVRVVLGHSPLPRHKHGLITPAQRIRLADLAGGAPGGTLVLLHHQLDTRRLLATYPPGIPAAESRPLLDALAAANPATLVSGGHTHRNRRRVLSSLVVTEIGSTKDYPGVWAGYAVHEGGIRQVVRRVAAPTAMAWTESTGEALYGIWRHWAAATRNQRCFSLPWPDRR